MMGKRGGFLHQPAVERSFGLDRQEGGIFPRLCKALMERLDQLGMLKRGTVLILTQGDGAHGKTLLELDAGAGDAKGSPWSCRWAASGEAVGGVSTVTMK
jgi:hypothetical protein